MTTNTPAAAAPARRKSDWRTIATLLPHLWPKTEPGLRARVVAAMACLLLAKVATVYTPLFYKDAVDALTPGGGAALAAGAAAFAIIGYGIVRVLGQAFGELRDALFARVAQRAMRSTGLATFRHLHALALRFHLERQTGGVTRAIERGVKGIEFLLAFMLFNILPTILEILMVCGVLWALFDIRFAAVTFVTIVSYIFFTILFTEWRTKFRREMNDRDQEAATKAVDSLLNFETVKYFGNEEHEARRFDRALMRYERAAVKSQVTLSFLNIGQGGIIAIGLASVMLMAADEVTAGAMTVGGFVLVNTYLIQLYLPLNFLGFVYRQIRQSLTDMEHMFKLLDVEREIADAPDAQPLAEGPGHVRFESIGFAYDERRPILKRLTLEIPAGRTVAVVGHSGSGKSTLYRLLFRFYDPQQGRVTIDGQDLRAVTQESLRRAIGIVPQDTVLFNDTVYYNILYGRPDATKDEVEEAARLARIHDFIAAMPDGYQTMVGERGLKLSGGEKQRVSIARVILKRPRILVFDEATSALDTATERAIQDSLEQVSADRTTLVIAHRLSTVVDADLIVVLDQGEVVESGSHAELLARGERYAAMWAAQLEASAAEGAPA